jgi:hypothetical protein
MPLQPVRLAAALYPTDYRLSVIDLDTKLQLTIDRNETPSFMADCDRWDADLFGAGLPITTTMNPELWETWHGFADEEPAFVWVSASPGAAGSVDALGLTDMREIAVPSDEATNFANDCNGCTVRQLAKGQSAVALMSDENWEAWLLHFEVCKGLTERVYQSLATA